MVLNDCFDYSEDCRDRPERPLPAQKINLNTAWFAGFTLILLGILSAAVVNQQMLIVSVVLALLVVIYDSNRLSVWPRSLVMGLCRYTNWLMALAILPLTTTSMLLPLPILCYVVGLTRLSQVETTEAPRTRVYELLFILLISIVILQILGDVTIVSGLVLIVLAGYFLSVILPLLKPHSAGQVQHTVGRLVLGLIPFDAAIGFVFGYWGVSLIVLSLIPLPKLVGRTLYVS
jgi:4-hydroxybenzoate polyprenyltransferase